LDNKDSKLYNTTDNTLKELDTASVIKMLKYLDIGYTDIANTPPKLPIDKSSKTIITNQTINSSTPIEPSLINSRFSSDEARTIAIDKFLNIDKYNINKEPLRGVRYRSSRRKSNS
jgi:hypothetical protein